MNTNDSPTLTMPRSSPLHCNRSELRSFAGIFSPFSLCAPVQNPWLRLAALCPFGPFPAFGVRPSAFSVRCSAPCHPLSSIFHPQFFVLRPFEASSATGFSKPTSKTNTIKHKKTRPTPILHHSTIPIPPNPTKSDQIKPFFWGLPSHCCVLKVTCACVQTPYIAPSLTGPR